MKIRQFIYTKLPPEFSPMKKSGFHTAFFSQDLLTKKDLLDIETKLHYPANADFAVKRTVFYQKIHEKRFLCVVFVQPLPDEKDEFGRSGVFMAHGFLVPQEVWQENPAPLFLAPYLEKIRFTSIKQLYSALTLNRQTGDIMPFEASSIEYKPQELTRLKALSENETALLLTLYKIATKYSEDCALVLKGAYVALIEELYNILFCYLPCELRAKLGWDVGFDGGKLFFYPLKVVGYTQTPPTTGNPLFYDMAKNQFLAHDNLKEWTQASSMFEHWLALAVKSELKPSAIECLWQVAAYLEGKAPKAPEITCELQEFTQANQTKIKRIFQAKAEAYFDEAWSTTLAAQANPERLLRIMLAKMDSIELAALLEEVILSGRLTPRKLKAPLPDKVVMCGSKLLTALTYLWRNDALTFSEIQNLSNEQKQALFAFLAETDWNDKDWFFKTLFKFPDLLNLLLNSASFLKIAQEWQIKQAPNDYKPFAFFAAQELLRESKDDFVQQNVDYPKLIDQYLAHFEWLNADIHKLIAVANKLKIEREDCHYWQAFFFPTKERIENLHLNRSQRKKTLETLTQGHEFDRERLRQLGFEESEISEVSDLIKHSVWDSIKKKVLKIFNG